MKMGTCWFAVWVLLVCLIGDARLQYRDKNISEYPYRNFYCLIIPEIITKYLCSRIAIIERTFKFLILKCLVYTY